MEQWGWVSGGGEPKPTFYSLSASSSVLAFDLQGPWAPLPEPLGSWDKDYLSPRWFFLLQALSSLSTPAHSAALPLMLVFLQKCATIFLPLLCLLPCSLFLKILYLFFDSLIGMLVRFQEGEEINMGSVCHFSRKSS